MSKKTSSQASYEDLRESFRRKIFLPVYFLYGDEEFLMDGAVDELIASAVEKETKDFNLDISYGSDLSAKEIVELAASYPMIGERRVVVVREFEKLSNKEPLLPYLERPSPSTSLVLLASKPDFRVKIFKVLAEKAKCAEFRFLADSEIPQWISRHVEESGAEISPEAVEVLRSYVGKSLREIHNEIQKVLLYAGDKKLIGIEEVNAVVGMSRQFNIYELRASIGAKNLFRSLEISEHMLQAGESAIGLITMLTRYFERLWIILDCLSRKVGRQEIAAALKFTPKQMYFLDEELRTAKSFSLSEIENGFRALARADERLKTSNGSVLVVITLLLHTLIHAETAHTPSQDYA